MVLKSFFPLEKFLGGFDMQGGVLICKWLIVNCLELIAVWFNTISVQIGLRQSTRH
jgi:hypothetical protein